jgi:hypothetical protein
MDGRLAAEGDDPVGEVDRVACSSATSFRREGAELGPERPLALAAYVTYRTIAPSSPTRSLFSRSTSIRTSSRAAVVDVVGSLISRFSSC